MNTSIKNNKKSKLKLNELNKSSSTALSVTKNFLSTINIEPISQKELNTLRLKAYSSIWK